MCKAQISAAVCRGVKVLRQIRLSHRELQSSGQRFLHTTAWDLSDLGMLVWFCYITAAFLCNCSSSAALLYPIIMEDDKPLLFLTAGSRLSDLKRISRSSCFHEATQTVVTAAKDVCLSFGNSEPSAVVALHFLMTGHDLIFP